MDELCSEENTISDELIEDGNVDDEPFPNFPFPNLKGDPDLLCEFNSNDENTISINEYLEEAIISNLSTLEFKCASECLICSEQFEEFQELLEHCKQFHKNEFDEYTCTVGDCDVLISDEDSLARHLVLRHSDLHSVKIYGSCPFCDLRFSNFNELNKHSCYRKISRRACIQPYCQYCKEEFVSHKRFLFHLQFHLAKRRPKVCLICNTEFIDVESFFLHVNYEHESMDKLACTICDRVFADLETYGAHVNMHKSKLKYKCDECSKVYHSKKLLIKHKENLHSAIEYKCDLCPKVFPTFSILQNHLKWHNTEAEVHVYTCTNCGLLAGDCSRLKKHTTDSCSECFQCEVEEEILTAAYSCHYCAQDFKDKCSLIKHRATGVHRNKKFICPICNEEIDSAKSKRLHMYKHKDYKNLLENLPLKRLLMCDVSDCEECYNDWAALQRHKTRIHKSNTCTKCNQKLGNADELQSHIQQCQSTALTCQFCDKICPTKMSLAVHVARRHNNKNVNCPHCAAGYKDEQTLQQHIEYSHLPVPCTNCEKVINCKKNLEVHMRVVHESESRYFCAHCNKGFYHRSQRDLHEESVHPDSVYKCGQCNFKTKYAKSLEIHMAKHLEKLEFKCPHCEKSFGRKNTLTLHIKRHKNDKPFRCSDTIIDGCDAAYITRPLLNNHIKSKHSVHQRKTKNAGSSKQRRRFGKQRQTRKNMNDMQVAFNAFKSSAMLETDSTDAMLTAENNSFAVVAGVPHAVDENYMLLVVNDEALQMVTDSNDQLLALHAGDVSPS